MKLQALKFKTSVRPVARIKEVIKGQLVQGITPSKLAWSLALGLNLGLFPILGTTTCLCALCGLIWKLNHPALQLANWIVAPLQPAMILLYIHWGEWISRNPHASVSFSLMIQQWKKSPWEFFKQSGFIAWHGVLGWMIITLFLLPAVYLVLRVIFKMNWGLQTFTVTKHDS